MLSQSYVYACHIYHVKSESTVYIVYAVSQKWTNCVLTVYSVPPRPPPSPFSFVVSENHNAYRTVNACPIFHRWPELDIVQSRCSFELFSVSSFIPMAKRALSLSFCNICFEMPSNDWSNFIKQLHWPSKWCHYPFVTHALRCIYNYDNDDSAH